MIWPWCFAWLHQFIARRDDRHNRLARDLDRRMVHRGEKRKVGRRQVPWCGQRVARFEVRAGGPDIERAINLRADRNRICIVADVFLDDDPFRPIWQRRTGENANSLAR